VSGWIYPNGGFQRIPVALTDAEEDFAGLWQLGHKLKDGRYVVVVFEAPRDADYLMILHLGQMLLRLKVDPEWTPGPDDPWDFQWKPMGELAATP
jgi:hypothetical protein